jgi:hypothetical protein
MTTPRRSRTRTLGSPEPRNDEQDQARTLAALQRLAELLKHIGSPRAEEVAALSTRFAQDPAGAWRALNANDWWAGAGSLAAETMADNPGLDPSQWQNDVRQLRELLIEIGETLQARGEPNPGLGSWLLAFHTWNDAGV